MWRQLAFVAVPGFEKAQQRRAEGLAGVSGKIEIGLASNDDGSRLRELSMQEGFPSADDLDWSDIYPYWLVARINGEVMGCIQIAMSKPVAYAEMLSIDRSVGHKSRALMVKELVLQASGTLARGGASMVVGMIPFELKSYKKILKKHGAVVVASGNLLAKRLK